MSRSPDWWKASTLCGAIAPTVLSGSARSAAPGAGQPSISPSEPSRRSIGGLPILRWMSLAPRATAFRRRSFRFMAAGLHRQAARAALGGRRVEPRIAAPCPVRERLDQLHRAALGAAGDAGMREVAADELLEDAPRDREAEDREGRAGEAVERELRAPARGRERPERAADRVRIRLEGLLPALQHVEDARRGKAGAVERFVHAVARDRVDHAGRIADDERAPACELRVVAAERQAVPADVAEVFGVDPVLRAQLGEACPQRPPLRAPPADA